ncbi:MAG: pyruvate dehydrogenase (acetyl-transferring) E1 component subunit alpha [Planctomycetes bacterium]|nr:pyruvate dehydrogenase (acetyl-transferring) E1 component subunit alpha [Planctomycetota bacterium]
MTAEVLRIIERDGKVAKGKDPNLSDDRLRKLYQTMVQARILDERGLALQRQGRIGFYLQALGQEASHVGSVATLLDSDWIFPAYRQPGIPLLRGADLNHIVCEWFGTGEDPSKGRQMPVHYSLREINFVSISSPIGTQISQAAGAAMAAKIRKDDTVFMTYFGDGATSSNDFHAGMNFAAVRKAPVVFVCENNQWAISTPVSMQSGSETMAQKAIAYGMPGVRVDGNDILAVYRVCKEAVDRARRGEGPTMVETVTYRMGSHSSADDASRYRDQEEFERWRQRDPILRFQKYLRRRELWTEEWEQEISENFSATLAAAVKHAEASDKPTIQSMFEEVYMNPSKQLLEQMEQLLSLKGPESDEVGEFPL